MAVVPLPAEHVVQAVDEAVVLCGGHAVVVRALGAAAAHAPGEVDAEERVLLPANCVRLCAYDGKETARSGQCRRSHGCHCRGCCGCDFQVAQTHLGKARVRFNDATVLRGV